MHSDPFCSILTLYKHRTITFLAQNFLSCAKAIELIDTRVAQLRAAGVDFASPEMSTLAPNGLHIV
jgi:hypothetical protein